MTSEEKVKSLHEIYDMFNFDDATATELKIKCAIDHLSDARSYVMSIQDFLSFNKSPDKFAASLRLLEDAISEMRDAKESLILAWEEAEELLKDDKDSKENDDASTD